jgi:hypothetical protein
VTDTKPLPSEIKTTVKRWRTQARWLRVIHVSLLVCASAFSILTASEIGGDQGRTYFAVLAALAVGVLSALDLGVKANGFRNAWRHMNAAMARYRCLEDFTVEKLIKAYEDAEALIGALPSGPRPAIQSDQSERTEERSSSVLGGRVLQAATIRRADEIGV